MNQIESIQLGVIAICIATVPLSLAQTPRSRTSGSNQTSIISAAPISTGSNGNATRASQIGINPGNTTITGATRNIGAHAARSTSVQTGISNHAIGITSAAAGVGGSSGDPTGVTQTGINAAPSTNRTAKAQTGTAAEARSIIDIVEPGATPALILFTATPTPAPTPSPSVSPSPSSSP